MTASAISTSPPTEATNDAATRHVPTARSAPASRARVAAEVRIALAYEPLNPEMIADVCQRLRIALAEYRTLFRSTDELMDLINDQLVEECAGRLARVVADFCIPTDTTQETDATAGLRAAAYALASARALYRGSILIRAERRFRSLRSPHTGDPAVRERRFQVAVEHTLIILMDKLGRPFALEPHLAVRVVLDAYERSIESWLLRGGNELDFAASTFVQSTLPQLLHELSRTSRTR